MLTSHKDQIITEDLIARAKKLGMAEWKVECFREALGRPVGEMPWNLEWEAASLFDGCSVLERGTRVWHLDGRLHREDGPAVQYSDGGAIWFRCGKCHRDGGPAFILADGGRLWYRHGKVHREDGPAVERADGRREWWLDGKRVEPF
jgi:hypothetical protein